MLRHLDRVVGVLVCALLLLRPANSDKVKRSVPLSAATWTADLRSFGYRDDHEAHQTPRLTFFHSADVFQPNNELIASFLTHEIFQGLQRRDDPRREFPYQLHVVIFDTTSGRALRQATWGSDSFFVGLIPRGTDGFAVFLGDRIEFYWTDLILRGELRLDRLAISGQLLSVSFTPDGKTILIQYQQPDSIGCVWVGDVAVSEEQSNCKLPAGTAISDRDVAAVPGTTLDPEYEAYGAPIHGRQALIRETGGSWKRLCDCYCNRLDFLEEDTILCRNSFDVLRIDGKTLFSPGSTKGTHESYSFATNSRLLAFPRFGAGQHLSEALVASIETRRQVFRAYANHKAQISELQGLALSSDGTLFAVQGDGVVRYFRLGF